MSGNILRSISKLTNNLKSVPSTYPLHRCHIEVSRNFHQTNKLCRPTSIMFPSLSPTMTEGAIKTWMKQEGDEVKAGDVLLVLETDKADMEMEADEDGILAKILVPAEPGSLIPVGQLIGVMADEGEDWKSVEIPKVDSVQPSTPAATSQPSSTQTQPVSPQTQDTTPSSAIGPAVRKLVDEYRVSLDSLKPSGPHGRILKGDVMEVIKTRGLSRVKPAVSPPSAVQPSKTPVLPPSKPLPRTGESFVDIPHSNMRKTIAKRLTQSKTTVPHTYASISCDVGKVTKLRRQFLNEDRKVSVNDFIIKAAAIALQRNPRVNSVWQGETTQISNTVDIAIAVATDNGLITPIVKDAAFLGVEEISKTVREMAGRARQGKLQPHEYQGGSFSISNLGMFGINEFTAVINPPQCAILAVGTSRLELGVDGQPQSIMTVQLSYDGRVIDHTEASQFLETFRLVIESPSIMLAGLPQQAAAL